MEISNQISEGLKLLAATSKIDDDIFRCLLEASLAALSNPDKLSETWVSQFADIDGKAAYAALLTVILEATRHDTDPTSLSSLLEEKKLEFETRIEKILKLFGIVKPKLQSGNLEYKSGPQYLINLVTEVPGVGEKKMQFACTLEEMQDLVGKLREASKLIERAANV
ncbi:COMM domain-containing protein 3-like [Ischnura elegans]|uniref:COMM domain-containing protein 3-like n=1 Tax=Ischnura elegans TaxID=197161 RepID=UPI001ED88361|nr:COMM domain-containing protein 3-like [Ischnura elegans]